MAEKRTLLKDDWYDKLEDGLYELARTVDNPNADRRVKRDWTKQPVWEKGMRLCVERTIEKNFGCECTDAGFTRITSPRGYRYVSSMSMSGRTIVPELALALRKVEVKSYDDALDLYKQSGFNIEAGVLRHLVESGKISVEDVSELLRQCEAYEGPFEYREED